MHKKPIYSFENGSSKGINDVPLLSVVAIEDTGGMPEITVPGDKQALIIVVAKQGSIGTIKQFIATTTNWMWFYNGGIESALGAFVKKSGDTMSGALGFTSGGSQTASINASTGDIGTDGNVTTAKALIGKELKLNPNMVAKMVGTELDVNNGSGGTMDMKLNGARVITDRTGVEHHEYATSSISGVLKMRRSGNVLYMTTNGNNA